MEKFAMTNYKSSRELNSIVKFHLKYIYKFQRFQPKINCYQNYKIDVRIKNNLMAENIILFCEHINKTKNKLRTK